MTVKRVDATVKTVGGDDAYPGRFEVILSAPTVDRDNEVVTAGCFNPLPDHVTFDVDHGLSVDKTVGSGRPFYDGDLLKVAGTFARTELAQTVRSLVADGHIRTSSVAMRGPKKETKDGRVHIVKAELLNGSFVSIPSCREALVLAAKAGARNSAGDQALVQEIHDEAVEAGATCPTPAGQDPMSTTAAQTIHDLASALGATCGGAAGDTAGRAGGGIRDRALRSLGQTTKRGGPVGQAEDELELRARALAIKAQAALADLAALEQQQAKRTRPAWDPRIVEHRGGVPISAGMAKALENARAHRATFDIAPDRRTPRASAAPGVDLPCRYLGEDDEEGRNARRG